MVVPRTKRIPTSTGSVTGTETIPSSPTSSSPMSLSTPMPSSVRLARLNDLDRICLVAAASFYHSPLFQYRKPFYDGHSIDTLDSEREKFRGAILDPNRVAIVVEGDLDPDESLRVYRSLKRLYPTLDHEYVPSMAGATRGIVGVAAFRLPSDSKSIGKFMAEGRGD